MRIYLVPAGRAGAASPTRNAFLRRAGNGIAALVLVVPWCGHGATLVAAQARGGPPQPTARAAIWHPPLAFEENRGQADTSARFILHGQGYALFLTTGGALLAVAGDTPAPMSGARMGRASHATGILGTGGRSGDPSPSAARIVRFQLDGSIAGRDPAGYGRLPGTSSYFLGNDRGRWRTGVPMYAGVIYRDVYPGVDQLWQIRAGRLTCSFVPHRGAAPRTIRIGVLAAGDAGRGGHLRPLGPRGANQLAIAPRVSLSTSPGATVRAQDRRARWAAEIGLRLVPGRRDAGVPRAAFDLTFGPSPDAAGAALAVDSRGNTYITGRTIGGMAVTAGAVQPSTDTSLLCYGLQGDHCEERTVAYVVKLAPSGTLAYATYLGGSSSDADLTTGSYYGGNAIAVDAHGQAVVGGSTTAVDLPVTAGAAQAQASGLGDGYVAKLSATGTRLLFSTYLGGAGEDSVAALGLDRAGAVYVTGKAERHDLPQARHSYQIGPGGGGDAFVAKLGVRGTTLEYLTYLGGSSFDQGVSIAVDPQGKAYVAGVTDSRDFPTTPGAAQAVAGAGAGDAGHAFAAVLNAAGSALRYGTYLGGSRGGTRYAEADSIATDAAGNTYVAGLSFSAAEQGGGDYPHRGCGNVFVVRLTAAGALGYLTCLPGEAIQPTIPVAGPDRAALGLGPDGTVYVAGGRQHGTAVVSRLRADGRVRDSGYADTDAFVEALAVGSASTVYVTGGIHANLSLTNGGGAAPVTYPATQAFVAVLSFAG